nr:MAG TPA: replisome organizer protein [Caudoviricetes sp.]
MDKSYYAIIPANVRYDEELKDKAKLLYGEITALTNEKGYCWASNNYFAELYKVNKSTISRLIKNLADEGYIKIELMYQGKEIIGRKIYLTSAIPIDKKINTPMQKSHEGVDEKINTPIDEKVKENNTLYNNTINNTLNNKKRKSEIDALIDEYTNNIDLKNNLYEFVKMRKGIKAAITTVGLKRLLNKLNTLANTDNDKIKILDNSIMNSWKGIFPLKSDFNKHNDKNKTGFNNFKPREMYEDEQQMKCLENKLLGWDKEE